MTTLTATRPPVDFQAIFTQPVQRDILLAWPQPVVWDVVRPPVFRTSLDSGGGGTPTTPAPPTTGQVWPRAKTNYLGGGGTD